jgi:hypothetical protein
MDVHEQAVRLSNIMTAHSDLILLGMTVDKVDRVGRID